MTTVQRLVPRDQIVLSAEQLARKLAEAHSVGYMAAISDANLSPRDAFRLRTNHEALFDTRVDLYTAIWKRKEKGL